MSFRRQYLVLAGVAVAGMLLGYGAVAKANVMPGLGRGNWYGYFLNHEDQSGTNVWPTSGGTAGCASDGTNAIPATVSTMIQFYNFVNCKLTKGTAQEKTGASFIIQTTIAAFNGGTVYTTNNPATAAEESQFASILSFESTNGLLNMNTTFAYTENTYYQNTASNPTGPWNDDAFFPDVGSAPSITFKSYLTGKVVFAVRRQCGNPVADANVAPVPQPVFTITPTVAVDNSAPAPGDTVHFTYNAKSNAATSPETIAWKTYNDDSNNAARPTQINSGNGGALAANASFVPTADQYTIPAGTPAGTQICRYLSVTPSTQAQGATNSADKCATVTSSVAAGCGALLVTPNIGPTDSYTLTGTVNIAGGLAAAQAAVPTTQFFIHVTGTGGVSSNNVLPLTAGSAGSLGTLTASLTNPATNSVGNYTVTYGTTGSVVSSCSGAFTVAYTPYLSIKGGDVAAGPGFGKACTPELSGITGNNLGIGNGYYGAGSQLGALSLGQIIGFASNTTLNNPLGTGSSSSGVAVPQPSGLAFSNTTATSTIFGATLARDPVEAAADNPADNSSWCVPDYTSDASDTTTAPTTLSISTLDQTTLNSLPSGGTYVVNGDLTTQGDGFGNLYLNGPGQPSRITLIVNGDVAIASHIKWWSGYNYVSGTTNIGSIPQFQLLVSGNIYITAGATQLNGFYDAQPTVDGGGNIYTCSLGFNYLTDNASDHSSNAQQDGNYYNDCSQPLTIYGSVAAKHISLLRTHGNLKTATGTDNLPAEQIVYAPELWLGDLSNTSTGSQSFDAITNLPPIL